MKHQKHTLSATAAIAAALALSATPLAAQSTDAPASAAPTMQSQPIEPTAPVAPAPAPTISIPDASPAPDASVAPAPEPSTSTAPTASGASDSVAPVKHTTTHTTVTRATTVTHSAPTMAAAPVAVAPAPATDIAPPPAVESVETTSVTTAPPPPAMQPTPTQTNNITGTLGVVLLALLALAILAAGLLFFRRRHPAIVESETAPVVNDAVEAPIADEPATVTPYAAVPVAAGAPLAFRRREPNPVMGALPSNGASVDLPAKLPEDYKDRAALLDRMVNAKPDKANPFSDRRARMHRARLIMQSLGTTFDREPWIDLSQYPNNWPELQRQYHKAA
jgi:hypothetical protein